MRTTLKTFALLACGFLWACGDSDGPGGSGAGGTGGQSGGQGGGGSGGTPVIDPQGACDIADRVGRFTIEKQTNFGVVQGTVSEGVVPTSVPEVVYDDGTCKLFKRRNLSCIPPCSGAQTCGENGECVPFPRQISVGTVTIKGLSKPTQLTPQQPGNTYFDPTADNPPYAPGSDIVLSAQGSDGGAGFTLVGQGSVPLTGTFDWVLVAGSPLQITWQTAGDPLTKILIELTVDQHGLSPLSLQCELDDSGSGSVPATVIDQLINSGVSGFPNGKIVRRTADKVETAVGCVDLVVGSPVTAAVQVSGFTPCDGDEDCVPPQTCNLQIEQCE